MKLTDITSANGWERINEFTHHGFLWRYPTEGWKYIQVETYVNEAKDSAIQLTHNPPLFANKAMAFRIADRDGRFPDCWSESED